ncbi:hypothetical protein IJG14_07215 [bacterium]|nr:hypothetical protein [bacterium]
MNKYFSKPEFKDKKIFIGISFSSISSNESAVAVLDENLKIILLDKLYTMHDIEHFLKNFQGIKNSAIAVSMAKNEVMINSRWKYLSRIYHPVNLNSNLKNRDGWANRFSKKGVDLFKSLKNEGYFLFRFDIHNSKNAFGCNSAFLDRTPADCKALQSGLKYKLHFDNLPNNMLPVSELEAILGAYTIYSYVNDVDNKKCQKLFQFHDIDVIGFSQGLVIC